MMKITRGHNYPWQLCRRPACNSLPPPSSLRKRTHCFVFCVGFFFFFSGPLFLWWSRKWGWSASTLESMLRDEYVLHLYFYFYLFFLARHMACGILVFLTRNGTRYPLQWKCRVLTAGPQGSPCAKVFSSRATSSGQWTRRHTWAKGPQISADTGGCVSSKGRASSVFKYTQPLASVPWLSRCCWIWRVNHEYVRLP